MSNKQKNLNVYCPECESPINIENPSVGKIVECQSCGIESEIIRLNPLTLAPLEEEK